MISDSKVIKDPRGRALPATQGDLGFSIIGRLHRGMLGASQAKRGAWKPAATSTSVASGIEALFQTLQEGFLPNGPNSEGISPRRPKAAGALQRGTTQAKACMTQGKLSYTGGSRWTRGTLPDKAMHLWCRAQPHHVQPQTHAGRKRTQRKLGSWGGWHATVRLDILQAVRRRPASFQRAVLTTLKRSRVWSATRDSKRRTKCSAR